MDKVGARETAGYNATTDRMNFSGRRRVRERLQVTLHQKKVVLRMSDK